MIDNLPPLRDIVEEFELKPKKSLGQNFLFDQNITDKIARCAGDISNCTVIEIGAGPGGLTRSLLRAGAKKLIAVEYDKRAISALQSLKEASQGRLEIINADALNTNLLEIAGSGNKKIVANLPYNIGTALLTNWLKQVRENKESYLSMTLMFQKEVAQRIVAKPSTKHYGRLAIISNWLCHCDKMFDLPPSAFVPPPKITSSIVNLTPKNIDNDSPPFENVEKITKAAFNQRRKMIRSSLKDYTDIMETLNIDTSKRAENIDIETYISISKAMGKVI